MSREEILADFQVCSSPNIPPIILFVTNSLLKSILIKVRQNHGKGNIWKTQDLYVTKTTLSGMYRNRRSWHRHNAFRGGQLGASGKNQEVVLRNIITSWHLQDAVNRAMPQQEPPGVLVDADPVVIGPQPGPMGGQDTDQESASASRPVPAFRPVPMPPPSPPQVHYITPDRFSF